MEKLLLSGEVVEAVIHDSGIYRYDGQNQPIDFASPSEGVLALEQVLNVTPGTKVKDLAFAYIDYMLRPDVQKLLAGKAAEPDALIYVCQNFTCQKPVQTLDEFDQIILDL